MSCMLRNSIRTLAAVLLVMGLVVNFDMIQSGDNVDDLAGRAGWWALAGEDWDGQLHLLLSLIPTAVLVVVSFYLSIMLWRYGTESAMVVHSSICNAWFYCFFGTVAMAVGQAFDEEFYTVMSNAGILIFIITILLVMIEIDKDMIATHDVACFLVSVGQKGDQIRIMEPTASLTMQQQHHDPPFEDEEKTPEDEEAGHDILASSDTKGSGMEVIVDMSSKSQGEDIKKEILPSESKNEEKGDGAFNNNANNEMNSVDQHVTSSFILKHNEKRQNEIKPVTSSSKKEDVTKAGHSNAVDKVHGSNGNTDVRTNISGSYVIDNTDTASDVSKDESFAAFQKFLRT